MLPSRRPPPSQSLPDLLAQRPAGRLYAIVDAGVCASANRAPLDVVRAFLAGGACLIQLRCKSMGSGEFLDLAAAAAEETRQANAMLIVNDRADVAALSRAAGLHLGQDDLPPSEARQLVGDAAILGLSTHTRQQWEAAGREPISYLAIGPVFGTGTKDTGYDAVGLDTVRRAASAAAQHHLPAVAIGGITIENARSAIDAGAASVAVITDLLKDEPEARVRAFLRILE